MSVGKKKSSQEQGKIVEEKAKNQEISKEKMGIGPENFEIIGLIGKGSFGEVYLVEEREKKQRYAMKVLNKEMIYRYNLMKYAKAERNVLSITRHPFLNKLNFAFQTSHMLILILDFLPGGDLTYHLKKMKKFSEELARIYLAEIVLALEHLHQKDIIFRDLKPDNIVLDADGHAVLTDFGLSKEGVLDHLQGARSFCGYVFIIYCHKELEFVGRWRTWPRRC